MADIRKAFENLEAALEQFRTAVFENDYAYAGLSMMRRDMRFIKALVESFETERRADGIPKEHEGEDQEYQCGCAERDGVADRDAKGGKDAISGRDDGKLSGKGEYFSFGFPGRGGH